MALPEEQAHVWRYGTVQAGDDSMGVVQPDIPGFRTDNRSHQTRFHFHMERCMGCHACEVACAEQNGLPPEVMWRRVGEVEAGAFPDVMRLFVSSGCNHCLDAACMKGCPVDAYQVTERGIVLHLDDVCIGCQYCTWNCPYGVPVYQADRRIVTKCDLCTHRLDQGLDPACVQACPAEAIEIESVPLLEIAETYRTAGAGPDLPDPEITMPSTKVSLPANVAVADLKKVDRAFIHPEDPHGPLIWMTVLTQLGLGGVGAVFLVDLVRRLLVVPAAEGHALGFLAPFLMGLTVLSLAASTLHLGRPIYAYRAMKNWRTSWLSREVIGLSVFAGAATVYAAFLLATEGAGWVPVAALGGPVVRLGLGAATVSAGMVGVYCSSMLYRVPARPAWNFRKTTGDFFLTALVLGPAAFVAAVAAWGEGGTYLTACARVAALVSGGAWLTMGGLQAGYVQCWARSEVFELAGSARLYGGDFFTVRALRNAMGVLGLGALLVAACGSVPGEAAYRVASALGLIGMAGCCAVHRLLFFTTVVPRNIPGNFHMRSGRG